MRMRAGVLWSAVALALLAVSSAQRRETQVEGLQRQSRRLPVPASAVDSNGISAGQVDNSQPTFRSRGSRRREETPIEVVRTRTRSRNPTERTQLAPETERPKSQTNERFDSRRTRTRSRHIESEVKVEKNTFTAKDFDRTRTRQVVRRKPTSTTQAPVEVSSPTIDESKIEIINTNIDDITKLTTKEENTATTQFRRRSSIAQTTETVAPRRGRGRINVRSNARSLDLDDSGTTNSIVIVDKAPTTARTSADLRNARKLRYKTRPSETDTNLTGEGIIALNEVKSSQKENLTSQPEIKISAPVVIDRIVQESTEPNKLKTTTLKVTRVVRRPLARGKGNARVAATVKPKSVETEINEDDNYPESFKALIQAKNASTQTTSPNSESLSVKASQKVYKTYNASLQSTQTGPAVNKYSRLRNKQKTEEEKQENEIKITETTVTPEVSSRSTEYRPRGKYSARNKKPTTLPSTGTTSSSISSSSSEKPAFKYSRKFKYTSTQAPKVENPEDDVVSTLKKPVIRPPVYSRKITRNFGTSTEVSVVTEIGRKKETILRSKVSLPRTSYYSRSRNTKNATTTTTTETIETESPNDVQKKTEDTDMPLIFTLLKEPDQNELASDSLIQNKENQESKEPFIISISSTESGESMTLNEVLDKSVESEVPGFTVTPIAVVKPDAEKHKFHANYKDQNANTKEEKTRVSSTTLPPVRNIQSRKYGKTRPRINKVEGSLNSTTPRSRERNVRKYSEAFSKTTEASNNGITPEPEKSKSRYSSKYRASYLDKPFYKPTVPSITSSTAWLKFFVTDHLLTKSVEEPNWFEGKDSDDVTTESLSRPLVTTPYNHEPSPIELVEREEIELGPDLNAISITQTRRTLSSADLRLSESLVKPLQVMNVEASQHSPSVTVSIFDALAEILTSTPKPRLSTTTEVTTKIPNTDVTQILNGVSNIVNVNSSGGTPSPETFVSFDASSSTSTKTVQNTVQTTPTVINNMSAGESVTPSLNTEVVTPVNTPTSPIPTPSTPVSARRPFAFKVLYSDTEPPTDKLSTAPDTSNQPTTDNPATVYNTVSDLLLSNNNLVSSELTSMLSNNIKSIIQNMDVDSRSRISGDMAKLLKSLIPRALDGLATGLNNAESIPDTTPYSLEDIRDTANINIDVDNNAESDTILQSVTSESSVNSVISNADSLVGVTDNPIQAVNNVDVTLGVTQSSTTLFSSQTTSVSSLPVAESSEQRFSFEPSSTTVSSVEPLTSSLSSDVDTISVNNDTSVRSSINNRALPFLTNFQVKDFTASTEDETINSNDVTKPVPLTLTSRAPVQNNFEFETQDPSQVSPLQLWVLSKKAKVLQMIEDLIRQHNSEIATAPELTEFISPSSNTINLSRRLTNIMNTMTFTTEATMTTTNDVTPPSTTSLPIPVSLSTTERTLLPDVTTSSIVDADSMLSLLPSSPPNDKQETTTVLPSGVSSRFGSSTQSSSDSIDTIANTTISTSEPSTESLGAMTTTEQQQGQEPEKVTDASSTTIGNTETSQTTTPENTETTTAAANTETTTPVIPVDTTTQVVETTPQSDNDSTTVGTVMTETTQNTTPLAAPRAATPATIPKKDYVIFGILPNNTVVRKDPNDDILESLTEASPYIVYGLLPNNTVIRKFPNGTRVPRIMQKIDILPISPWSLRNPYSPIHNIPAIVRPRSNPIRVSTNTVTSTDITNNGTENRLTTDTISSSALNIKSSSLGITTATKKPPAEISTASHVLSLRTTTMLPSIDEILLNSISSAAKQEMVISSMTSSTREPRILTLDIDPETQQIRTERPGGERDGKAIFKFIPIDEVMVQTQKSNVLKLATKSPSTTMNTNSETQIMTEMSTETNTPTQASTTEAQATGSTTDKSETVGEIITVTNAPVATTETTTIIVTTEATTTTSEPTTTTTTTETPTTLPTTTTTPAPTITTTTMPTTTTTTQMPTTTQIPTTLAPTTTTQATTLTTQQPTTTLASTTTMDFRTTVLTTNFNDEIKQYQSDIENIQSFQASVRDPKNLNIQSNANSLLTGAASGTTTRIVPTSTAQQNDPTALLQALFAATGRNPNSLSIPNFGGNAQVTAKPQTTTSRSIEEDIKQFEEDTKFLKALLQATGQNPANLNIPSLDSILTTTRVPLTTTQPTTTPQTTTTTRPTTTTTRTTTTARQQTTTQSIEEDLKQFQEDAKLLQALLQATGQNPGNLNLPVISGITSNVRVASNPQTTSIGSNPTTPLNVRPVFSTTQSGPVFQTFAPRLSTTLQPTQSTTEDVGISTTFPPFNRRQLTTTARTTQTATLSGRQAPGRFSTTTEIPSTSTFSVEEDLLFLQNLKNVLNTNPNSEDPEAALANRIISLAVERSLTEIQSGAPKDAVRTGKNINNSANNLIPTTTMRPTTTRPTTTTTPKPITTTIQADGPSIEDDIKQFQEDTKLLQALIKATGQDPSQFNIPTLPSIVKPTVSLKPSVNDDLKLLSNLLASPSPLNEPFDSLTPKPTMISTVRMTDTTTMPFGAKIVVKDDLKTVQDDGGLIKTLIKLQGAQETTTMRSKLALTGQTSDEALKKLLQQQQQSTGMVSEATKAPISLSTEYGKSNDALLAALLKEQGFGPTTASSLDEQLRLAALLNQVVVTPKARRTTTPPPPPPAPRRPILDGLAWLWQQWRETGPGPAPASPPQQRPNRRPVPSSRPEATTARASWFGSGPFVGNADDRPTANRIPLEPPRAVASEQPPGRGQLVSAAINVTRAFSQFLGAAIQGAAQTVQNVIRAGQRAAGDVYTNGSAG